MAEVLLKNICKIYDGGVKAVDNVNVDIKDQEFSRLLITSTSTSRIRNSLFSLARQAVESPQRLEWLLALRISPLVSSILTASS